MLFLVTQSCLSDWLYYPMDCSPPGSSVHGDSPSKNIGVSCHALPYGIFPTQELNSGLLHCRGILYHLGHQGSRKVLRRWQIVVQLLSYVRLFVTPCAVACQVPLSIGFPRQEYWSGLPFPPPEDLPEPGIKSLSPASAGGFFTTEPPGKPWQIDRNLEFQMPPCLPHQHVYGLFTDLICGDFE